MIDILARGLLPGTDLTDLVQNVYPDDADYDGDFFAGPALLTARMEPESKLH